VLQRVRRKASLVSIGGLTRKFLWALAFRRVGAFPFRYPSRSVTHKALLLAARTRSFDPFAQCTGCHDGCTTFENRHRSTSDSDDTVVMWPFGGLPAYDIAHRVVP
jgi:hypothetical protein